MLWIVGCFNVIVQVGFPSSYRMRLSYIDIDSYLLANACVSIWIMVHSRCTRCPWLFATKITLFCQRLRIRCVLTHIRVDARTHTDEYQGHYRWNPRLAMIWIGCRCVYSFSTHQDALMCVTWLCVIWCLDVCDMIRAWYDALMCVTWCIRDMMHWYVWRDCAWYDALMCVTWFKRDMMHWCVWMQIECSD